jgi:meiosis induction protein kinase IME2/SME1
MADIALEDCFEALEDIGDGTFASVASARVRASGSNVARRGTIVSKIDSHRYYKSEH